MKDSKQIIEFKFETPPEYRRVHATGFWGITHPAGELLFDIIEDVPEYPDVVRLILPDNLEEREPASTNTTRVKRIRHIGVILPMSSVPDIIKWLQERLDEFQASQQQENKR
ncbi:MAG: hypothetical protein HPY90_07455 [Syntrophothermus sp.]|uniref:hypothetical protein n=1 Tax=Syntrophothermus sp. TaxID=2736299 RepID=UPI00257B86BC|nr:hypothetical protein [Syntrophothermus sp.]NSW83098.1 hypothetical protein [Syntrophothermus sp.]